MVGQSVRDWKPTLNKLNEVRNEIKALDLRIQKDDLKESLEFIDWIEDEAFIFLGFREYEVQESKTK